MAALCLPRMAAGLFSLLILLNGRAGLPLQTRWMCGMRQRWRSASRAPSAASSMGMRTCWRPSSQVGATVQSQAAGHAARDSCQEMLCTSRAVPALPAAGRAAAVVACLALSRCPSPGSPAPPSTEACIDVVPKNPHNFNVDNVRVVKINGERWPAGKRGGAVLPACCEAIPAVCGAASTWLSAPGMCRGANPRLRVGASSGVQSPLLLGPRRRRAPRQPRGEGHGAEARRGGQHQPRGGWQGGGVRTGRGHQQHRDQGGAGRRMGFVATRGEGRWCCCSWLAIARC